ncbi:MAG TPA: TatD family hydrolase [Tepidisphaeraceae bacterium]|nr:TatD family hydrolase [Tepidisphaeraceae bacterium]
MIDTHCHLTDPRLKDQLDQVIERARLAGVNRIITIATNLADAQDAISLCENRAELSCVIGIHPNYGNESMLEDIDLMRGLALHPKVVALGEMGLDYHWDTVPRDRQLAFFEKQLALAAEMSMPVVIHSREAILDSLDVMKSFPTVRAVFHSFTGTPDEVSKIVEAGYFVGFTGPVTYKKNDELRDAARLVPIDRIFVETDAPYLSPEPVRAQRINEPAHVMHIAQKLAEMFGMLLEDFDAQTTRNAESFFRWK